MSALVVFSVDVRRLATFYAAVLGMEQRIESSGDIRLFGEGEEVLVHSLPASVAQTMQQRTPPLRRENSPFKPAFDVDSLQTALRKVEENGGAITSTTFSIDGITRYDVLDPDGNVIQLRATDSHSSG